jgi:hypothetical protein
MSSPHLKKHCLRYSVISDSLDILVKTRVYMNKVTCKEIFVATDILKGIEEAW